MLRFFLEHPLLQKTEHSTAERDERTGSVSELKDTEQDVSKFEEKLHKLIKRAKKQRGMLWPSVVSALELARADVRAMIKIYKSGPK
jgi:hypothetical protein